MNNTGTYQKHAALEDLPTLVRRQRRLEKVVAQVTKTDIEDEKACRKVIDELLVKAGIQPGELVTCNGYDVIHNEQKGRTALDISKLGELLVLGGVDPEFVKTSFEAATTNGDPVTFALVKPSKGAKVRT